MHSHIDPGSQLIDPSPQVVTPICGILAQFWGHLGSCVIIFRKPLSRSIRKLRVNTICDVLMGTYGCGSNPYQTRQSCVVCNKKFSRFEVTYLAHHSNDNSHNLGRV